MGQSVTYEQHLPMNNIDKCYSLYAAIYVARSSVILLIRYFQNLQKGNTQFLLINIKIA